MVSQDPSLSAAVGGKPAQAVAEIMRTSDLVEADQQIQDDAFEATVRAALHAVGADRDPEVDEALLLYRRRGTSPGSNPTDGLSGIMRKRVGYMLERRIGSASYGAGMAAEALMTWDLATEEGPYTFQHRQTLVAAWTTIAPLPPAHPYL